MVVAVMQCCGYRELEGLRFYVNEGPSKALTGFISAVGSYPRAFRFGAVVFSEAGVGATYATKLADFIVENGLGTIVAIPEFNNPNSLNNVRSFVWIVDRGALDTWHLKTIGTLTPTGI